jgi:hypothetical protein
MTQPYAERLDANNDRQMDAYNEVWHAFMDQEHINKEAMPEYVTRTSAVRFLNCSKQFLATLIYRKTVRQNADGYVLLDDVLCKKLELQSEHTNRPKPTC